VASIWQYVALELKTKRLNWSLIPCYVVSLQKEFKTMKTNYYIFFSWQSDVKGNKPFIDNSIKDAINEIKADPDWANMNITYDHSTMNRSGSPSIVDTIHQKINSCDVFIADITPIAAISGKGENQEKLIPNPNVMAESGFALRALGENQIIFLMKSGTGDINDLPFDIRHRRINTFNRSEFGLAAYIKSAFETAKKRNQNVYDQNVISHDKNVYIELAKIIRIEENLYYHIERIAASQKLSYYQSDLLHGIVDFINSSKNQFLIDEVNQKAHLFKNSITTLLSFTGQNFSPLKSSVPLSDSMTQEEMIEYNKKRFFGWIDKEAGEYWQDEERYHNMHNKVMNFMMNNTPTIEVAYKDFRASIKRNLFI
jgi:hypothetical protein